MQKTTTKKHMLHENDCTQHELHRILIVKIVQIVLKAIQLNEILFDVCHYFLHRKRHMNVVDMMEITTTNSL